MEFELDVQHGLNGHVEITDYSKEYDQYYSEEAEGMTAVDKFKYSQSNSINVITKVNADSIALTDVLLDDHTQDKETLLFDVPKDGYYTVTHFVLPTIEWLEMQTTLANTVLIEYSTVYYVNAGKIYKRTVTSQYLGNQRYSYTLGEEESVSIRELLERNIEGTPIQKCQIDIFYTGYLQECYINHCRELFNDLMAHCRPNCKPKNADPFARDFLWMTLNVMDYLVARGQFNEAERILEEINYCGGFCNNVNNDESVCGCNKSVSRGSCGCSQK